MPIKSRAQEKLLYAAARRGEEWARKYLRDSGREPPPVERKLSDEVRAARKRRRR